MGKNERCVDAQASQRLALARPVERRRCWGSRAVATVAHRSHTCRGNSEARHNPSGVQLDAALLPGCTFESVIIHLTVITINRLELLLLRRNQLRASGPC